MECSIKNKTVVKTFVVFDTESTGLPSPGNDPRITELCFIAVTKEEFLTKQRACRVLNKLVLCFNPNKYINPASACITGLYNDALENHAHFGKQVPLIKQFLVNLPQPVCLIAHNGNGFDFPLLVAHLRDADENVSDESILCADSLEAFRSFDGLPPVPDFVMQKRRLNQKLAAQFSASVDVDERQAEASESNTKMVDTHNDNVTENINAVSQKRAPDSERLLENDVRCKQLKLSPTQAEAWSYGENTPQATISRNISSYVDKLMPCPQDNFTERNKVTRKLFQSANVNKHGCITHDHPTLNENVVCSHIHSVNRENFSDGHLSMPLEEGMIQTHTSAVNNGTLTEENGNCILSMNKSETNDITCNRKKESNLESDIHLESAPGSSTLDSRVANSNRLSQKNGNTVLVLNETEAENTICRKTESCLESDVPLETVPGKYACVESQDNVGNMSQSSYSCSQVRNTFSNLNNGGRVSYSLSSLYTRTFGQEPATVHTAESDCLTLLELLRSKMHMFSSWCDENAIPLKSIDPMYKAKVKSKESLITRK